MAGDGSPGIPVMAPIDGAPLVAARGLRLAGGPLR